MRHWVVHGGDNGALALQQKGISCGVLLAHAVILFAPSIIRLNCRSNLANRIR